MNKKNGGGKKEGRKEGTFLGKNVFAYFFGKSSFLSFFRFGREKVLCDNRGKKIMQYCAFRM